MGFFDSFGDLFDSPAPACRECDVTMEYSEAEYAPKLGASVEAYVCSECGRKVVASDHADMQDSTAGTAPERDRGGGSTGVIPMDSGYDDPDEDDGWRSVR